MKRKRFEKLMISQHKSQARDIRQAVRTIIELRHYSEGNKGVLMVYNEKSRVLYGGHAVPLRRNVCQDSERPGRYWKGVLTEMTKKMTRKRFCKLLMAHGVNRNTARGLAQCINVARRYDFIDGFTIKFVNGQKYQVDNVHSYREAYESTQKDGVPLV